MTCRISALVLIFATLANLNAAERLGSEMIVSVADQELAILTHGKLLAKYPVSTSKFGVGDLTGSYRTPLGTMFVSAKIGDGLPIGAVIQSRVATGEVLAPNAPGRDPIVSRVIWLRGKEDQNRNSHRRCIYIHGTAEERRVGKPASYGCIRMRSRDVIALYERAHIGMHVIVTPKRLDEVLPPEEPSLLARQD